MKKILLILNISVLAITARGSLVLVSGTGGNTYDANAAYRVNGSFGGSVPIQEVGGLFSALASGNLARLDLGLTYDAGHQGPVNAYLYGDAGGSPDNANQIFLGSGTPTALFGTTNNSIVSFAIAGTVPVTMGTTYWLVLKPGTTNTSDEWNLTSPPILGTVAFSPDDSIWTVHPPVAGFIHTQFNLWGLVPDSGSTILLMLGSVATLSGLRRMFSRPAGQPVKSKASRPDRSAHSPF